MNNISRFWEQWKKVAEKIGNFQAGIIFSILYFLLVLPMGIIASRFLDILATRSFPKWQELQDTTSSLKKMKLQ